MKQYSDIFVITSSIIFYITVYQMVINYNFFLAQPLSLLRQFHGRWNDKYWLII